MSTARLEDRVAALEAEVARLRARLEPRDGGTAEPWWRGVWGKFADDPAFEEAMRLGREYRESLRPKSKAKRKRRMVRSAN